MKIATSNKKKFVWEYLDGTPPKELEIDEKYLSRSIYVEEVYSYIWNDEAKKFGPFNALLVTKQDYNDYVKLLTLANSFLGADMLELEELLRKENDVIRIALTTETIVITSDKTGLLPGDVLVPYSFKDLRMVDYLIRPIIFPVVQLENLMSERITPMG